MPNDVNPIPEDWPSVTPMLGVRDAAAAIDWYVKALGGVEEGRLAMPDGKIGYAMVRIGDTPVALADENPEWGNHAPTSLGGTPVRLHLYVTDADAVFERAVAEGAKVLVPLEDQFYGDRAGRIEDPFGHYWIIATHVRDVSTEEMERAVEGSE